MPRRYWTCYWKEKNWKINEQYARLQRTGGVFSKRGVAEGDVMYVISQRAGQLLLGGRMTVKGFGTHEDAIRDSKHMGLYNASEWAFAKNGSGTPLHHNRQLAPEVTKRLRLKSKPADMGKPLLFVNDHDLDRQTTRIVRELTPESADLLDEIMEMTDNLRLAEPPLITVDQLRMYRTKRSK